MTKSLYAVLNVAPDADPAVIEAAYKALMKKYHPDMLPGEASADQRKAAEISEAFQILRDPERRARYDNEERARQQAFRRAAAMAAAVTAPSYHVPPPRRRARWPKVLLLLAAVLAGFMLWSESEEVRRVFASRSGAIAASPPPAGGKLAAVQLSDVERALAEYRRIKDETGLLGLSFFSQDCFAHKGRLPSVSDLDFCIAFDHAAADYDARIAGDDLPQLARFQPAELSIRHETAARAVSADQQWIDARLAQLRALTYERLQPEVPQLAPAALQQADLSAAPKARSSAKARKVRSKRIARSKRARPSDRDFLEREGYIY